MAAIIEIENLTKKFGARTAIDGLTLNVNAGEIFGFVGPNGAGKTSTIRVMTTLLQQTAGDVRIAGCSAQKDPAGVRRVTGYMPDVFGLYRSMKVWEYLDFFAGCYHIPEMARPGLIDDLLELVDLSHRREDMVESLSRGMQQRLSLARTLVHDPQVLILDEPASGLDPRARVEIRELLVELAHMGKTIFFSTHILADVAEICTRVGIIEAGKLVALGELEALQQQVMPLRTVEVTLLSGIELALELLGGIPAVNGAKAVGAQNGRQRLEFEFSGDDLAISQALAALVAAGIPVLQFTSGERDLEAVFMRATRGLVT
jgi:ABC-2 type transport system ATP-binding protein